MKEKREKQNWEEGKVKGEAEKMAAPPPFPKTKTGKSGAPKTATLRTRLRDRRTSAMLDEVAGLQFGHGLA